MAMISPCCKVMLPRLTIRFYDVFIASKRYNTNTMSEPTTLPDNMRGMTELVSTLQQKLDHQSLFIEQLLEQIKLEQHQRFGVKSEAISPDQLRLLLEESQSTDGSSSDALSDESVDLEYPIKPPQAKRGRRSLPAHLPRIDVKHTLDHTDSQCEHCQHTMVPLSEKITEQLDIIPAKMRVLRHHRQTYHCPACKDALKTAPLPPQPIPKSNAAPSLLAYLIIAKYLDGSVPRVRGSKGLEIVRNFTIDEGLAPRSRLAGAGFKPLQAAGVKSLGGERCSKRCGNDRIRWDRERRTQVNRYCRVKTYLDDVEPGRGR